MLKFLKQNKILFIVLIVLSSLLVLGFVGSFSLIKDKEPDDVVTPGVTPDNPGETPDNPGETPDDPGETPDNPDEPTIDLDALLNSSYKNKSLIFNDEFSSDDKVYNVIFESNKAVFVKFIVSENKISYEKSNGTQVLVFNNVWLDSNYKIITIKSNISENFKTLIETFSSEYVEVPVVEYLVIFKDYNSNVLKQEKVAAGSDATAPSNPVRTGHTFVGWDTSFTNVNSSLVVNALYEVNKYTVKLYSNESDYEILEVSYGEKIKKPTDPVKEDYAFVGWFNDVSKTSYDFNSIVSSDLIIVPKFVKSLNQTLNGNYYEINSFENLNVGDYDGYFVSNGIEFFGIKVSLDSNNKILVQYKNEEGFVTVYSNDSLNNNYSTIRIVSDLSSKFVKMINDHFKLFTDAYNGQTLELFDFTKTIGTLSSRGKFYGEFSSNNKSFSFIEISLDSEEIGFVIKYGNNNELIEVCSINGEIKDENYKKIIIKGNSSSEFIKLIESIYSFELSDIDTAQGTWKFFSLKDNDDLDLILEDLAVSFNVNSHCDEVGVSGVLSFNYPGIYLDYPQFMLTDTSRDIEPLLLIFGGDDISNEELIDLLGTFAYKPLK